MSLFFPCALRRKRGPSRNCDHATVGESPPCSRAVSPRAQRVSGLWTMPARRHPVSPIQIVRARLIPLRRLSEANFRFQLPSLQQLRAARAAACTCRSHVRHARISVLLVASWASGPCPGPSHCVIPSCGNYFCPDSRIPPRSVNRHMHHS